FIKPTPDGNFEDEDVDQNSTVNTKQYNFGTSPKMAAQEKSTTREFHQNLKLYESIVQLLE
ncbi:hypothetical protein L9F63_015281, partial [Diploptera punctata]